MDIFKIKTRDTKNPDFKKIPLKNFFEKRTNVDYTRSSIHGVKGETYDAVSTYQRNALIKNRIPFIVPNSQIYVPELGMCLRKLCAGKREKVEHLSAIAQYLLLYFIYKEKIEEVSQAELMEHLDMSAIYCFC